MPALHAPVLRIPSSGVFLRAWPRFLVATPPTGASGQGGSWDPCLQIQHVAERPPVQQFSLKWILFWEREKKKRRKKNWFTPPSSHQHQATEGLKDPTCTRYNDLSLSPSVALTEANSLPRLSDTRSQTPEAIENPWDCAAQFPGWLERRDRNDDKWWH